MINTKRTALTLILSAAVLLGPVAAHADPGHGHGQGQSQWMNFDNHNDDGDRDGDGEEYHHHRHHDRDHDRDSKYAPDSHDREILRRYAEARYRKHCPPGLAKKHNGCRPPGHDHHDYEVGQALPPDVVYTPVPQSILSQLQPVPDGYKYVQVDNDVVLLGTLTKQVIDAFTANRH